MTSPESSDSWASSHARHLTKDLGAYSPRETHIGKLMSVCELYNHTLLVGTPIALTQEKGSEISLKQPREQEASPGNKEPSTGSRLAMLSLRLVKIPSLVFASRGLSLFPLRLSSCFSLLRPMGRLHA